MPYYLDGNCVRKGTKEEPGETVKCHDTHEEALAHMRALYVHVEDADKGGPGSGWHAPAEGTHTAANAPNFAGGPGADRVYGKEDEKPPKPKRCKCSKCGAEKLLPKGEQCEDVECPSCGSGMAQTEPREDKPAGGEEGRAPSAGRKKAVHGEGEKAMWTVYKSADGTLRWLALCNWAVVDREAEVISEKAYQDGIAYAQKTGQWGELDLVHVRGSDVGDCDTLFIAKQGDEPAKLGAGGTWRNTPVAAGAHRAVQERPTYWGMSEKFAYNPRRKVGGIYTRDIRYLKHTILPRAMAASHGTAIAVEGGQSMKELSEDQRKALAELNVSEEQIAEWAEKQKTLPAEENVVEKQDEATETPEEEVKEVAVEPEQGKVKQLIAQLASALGISTKQEAPVASAPEEAGKGTEVTDPAKAAQPAETKQAGGEAEGAEATGEMLQAFGTEIAKSLGTLVQAELATRDEQIAGLEETVKALREEVTIASKSAEERVEEALRNVPPVVTVAASQVQATVQPDGQPKGLTFGQRPEVAEKYTTELLESIERLVDQRVKGAKYKA